MYEIKRQYLNEIGEKKNVNEIDKFEWYLISQKKLSENFIREFKDKISWGEVSMTSTLSEEFIQEFADDVDWLFISSRQILSENFIIKNQNDVYWNFISKCQILSDDFLIKYSENIYWDWYFLNQEASLRVIKKFILKTTFKSMRDFKISHLNELEKQEVEKLLKLRSLFKKQET